jgi:hypothetical protein
MSLVVPPYPEPRYLKDEPEVSAWIKRADQPPDYETYGVQYHYLANQQATAGDWAPLRAFVASTSLRPEAGPARTFTGPCPRRSSCFPAR